MTDHIVKQAQEKLPYIPLSVVSQGAEGIVFETSIHPYSEMGDNASKYIVKFRPSKPYRHPKIDKQITKTRTIGEAKFMSKLIKLGIPSPSLISINATNGIIWMEYVGENLVNGQVSSLKNWLWLLEKSNEADCESLEVQQVLNKVGGIIAKLHLNEMIHGDLTSSNIMLQKDGNDTWCPVLIDFGLSSYSGLAEDKAVDLYVLERAILSTHSLHSEKYNEWLLQGYSDLHKDKEYKGKGGAQKLAETFKRLADVRLRGRKRSMLG